MWMVGAGWGLSQSNMLADDLTKVQATVEVVLREYTSRAPPGRSTAAAKHVGCAISVTSVTIAEKRASPEDETISQEKDVDVPSRPGRERAEVINTGRDAGSHLAAIEVMCNRIVSR